MHARPILVALATLTLTSATQAVSLLNTGFEAPDYHTGNLAGQNGWDATGLFPEDIVSANVQTAIVKSGSQAVSLSGSGTGAGGFAYNVTPFAPTTDKLITIDFDMNWGTAGSTRSYLYGVQAYDTDLNLIASVGVAQILGIYSGVVFDPNGLPVSIPNASVTPGDWHHFQLVLNYDTQSYHAMMDTFASGEMPFETSGITNYGEADLFRDAGLGNANDTAFYDNVSVQTGNLVPEPATLGMVGGVVVTALRRKR